MEDRDLLRIALTMNGGVSLAVWMGGVSAELLELVRSAGDQPPGPSPNKYAALTRILRYEPQVDIISGTSAGGLNGVVLGCAMANGVSSLDKLRDIWLDEGDVQKLLRSADEPEPRSLLQGDGVFLPSVERGLRGLLAPPPARVAKADWPIRLFVSTTLLEGEPRLLPDDFDETITDTDHQILFEFRYPGSETDGVRNDLDGGDDVKLRRLARAARSSAAFPFAFEPSLVTRDMNSVIRDEDVLSEPAWVVDGGILLNRPIGPALGAIFSQNTTRPVRRVLAYINPDPGRPGKRAAAVADDPPRLSAVLSAALVTIPRNESISSEIDRLRDHNRAVRSQREGKDTLAVALAGPRLVDTAATLIPAYRRVRAVRSVGRTLDTMVEIAGKQAPEGQAGALPSQEVLRSALLQARLAVLPDPARFFPPDGPMPIAPDAAHPLRHWPYGIYTAQRIVGTVIDLLRRVSAAAPMQPGDGSACGAQPGTGSFDQTRYWLTQLRRWANGLIDVIERAWATDRSYWRVQVARLQAAMEAAARGEGPVDVAGWARRAYFSWGDTDGTGADDAVAARRAEALGAVGEAALQAAVILAQLRQTLDFIVGDLPEGYLRDDTGPEPRWQVVAVVEALTDAGGAIASEDEILRRLLALEVIQLVGGQEEVVPQEIELMQISALASQHLLDGGPADAAAKLAGVELGHFAAFLKRSWRANDWMWGRLDAAGRIVSMVVEARRLRQLYGHDVAGLHADVRQLATASPDPAMAQWLAARWSDRYEAAVRDELAALLAGDSAELAVTRAAVAGALQAEVLRHEMTRVYQAIAADSAAGSDVARSHVFRRQFEAAVAEPFASPSTVRSASGLVDGAFAAYAVGAETVGDELTSDRGVKTALHAAVVAVGAVGSEERLRNVTPPARGALLWAHRLYRYFTTNSPLGRLARFVVFAIAGGLISVAFISGDANPLLSVFGLAALLIAVLLGITPEPRLLLAMVGLVAVAVLVWHAGSLADLRSWGVAIVLGGVVLLLAAVWWRGLLPAVMSLALMAVLVVGSLAAVRYIDPVQEWVVGGEASAPQEPPADPEIEELVAALEARLGPGTVTIDRGTGLDGFLGWVEEHRIEIVALLLIVGFGFLGAYRSRVL